MKVREVAELAKLALTKEEEICMEGELQALLNFATALQQVDTTGVPMTTHIVHQQNVLREDCVEPSLDRETVLNTAPRAGEGYISVPKAFE